MTYCDTRTRPRLENSLQSVRGGPLCWTERREDRGRGVRVIERTRHHGGLHVLVHSYH